MCTKRSDSSQVMQPIAPSDINSAQFKTVKNLETYQKPTLTKTSLERTQKHLVTARRNAPDIQIQENSFDFPIKTSRSHVKLP